MKNGNCYLPYSFQTSLMKIKSFVFGVLLCIISSSSFGQDKVKQLHLNYAVTMANSVDSTVVSFIEDYLNEFSIAQSMGSLDRYWSRPLIVHDSIYDLGLQFLTRGYELNSFLDNHDAILLEISWLSDSICKGSVLFMRNQNTTVDDRGKIRAIYEYNVFIQNGKPIFINNIDLFLKTAKKKTCDNVNYYYQDRGSFSRKDAMLTKRLSQEFSKYFDPLKGDFDFIICRDMKELGNCLNFQTSYMVKTTGMASNPNHFLISALNSAYYPHESVHIMAPITTPGFLWEGLATYFGGSQDMSYKEFINNDDRLSEEIITKTIENEKVEWYYNYVFGALLCEYLFNAIEVSSYMEFVNSFDTFSQLLEVLEKDHNVTKSKLTNDLIAKYEEHKGNG
jgi:hypothetical protein